jgi:hypothetical protein
MATKNLIPRGNGEGGIGIAGTSWGSGVFNTGVFNDSLTVGGSEVALSSELSNYVTTTDLNECFNYTVGLTGHIIPDTNAAYDLGNAEYKIRHLFLSDNSLHIGGTTISAGDTLGEIQFPSGILVTEKSTFNGSLDLNGRLEVTSDDEPFTIYDERYSNEKRLRVFSASNGAVFGLQSNGEDVIRLDGRAQTPNDSFFNGGNLGIGIKTPRASLDVDGDLSISGVLISGDSDGRILFGDEGIMVGSAAVKPDPDNPESIYFQAIPQVKDSEGNAVTVLTADKLGLGTTAVLESAEQDLQFKLLTDQQRFVVGTTGDYGLESGWYRFNDFKVKGATDIGSEPINPVDTRIYSDESSFILFKTDVAGNRVAHLVGGDEDVSPNNAIALGIAVKVDSSESPEDIEFVHTDGESYSVINGNSDSLGTNGLPIRQGFQSPSLGSNPVPLLIDGGSF